jgi:hypothetical protein
LARYSEGIEMKRTEESSRSAKETETVTDAQFTVKNALDETPAWEEVSTGRYMPRRIKGSYKGRALG